MLEVFDRIVNFIGMIVLVNCIIERFVSDIDDEEGSDDE